MVKEFKNKKEWALILGGSSGLGFATAKKLAKHGMNICIVHRNPRSHMEQVNKNFKEIVLDSVAFVSYNMDALKLENRIEIVENLKKKLKEGKIKILVHSIAKGNLKPMVSNTNTTLKSDDFKLTIDAMGISL